MCLSAMTVRGATPAPEVCSVRFANSILIMHSFRFLWSEQGQWHFSFPHMREVGQTYLGSHKSVQRWYHNLDCVIPDSVLFSYYITLSPWIKGSLKVSKAVRSKYKEWIHKLYNHYRNLRKWLVQNVAIHC